MPGVMIASPLNAVHTFTRGGNLRRTRAAAHILLATLEGGLGLAGALHLSMSGDASPLHAKQSALEFKL
jgi:hypothetical protein